MSRHNRDAENSFRGEWIVPAFQLFVLWVIVIARCFLFNDFAHNEVDILPSARQSVEGSRLSQDWYLNREIGYRGLFNQLAGPLVSTLGFRYGAVVGRLLLYLLFAGSILVFFRTFRIRFAFGLLLLILFLNNQSLIAGEWMVGGLETKALAWPLVLFAISAFARKKWLAGFAFAGGALSFHILVGLYLLPCLGLALLLNRKEYDLKEGLRHVWIFFLTGAWGLYAVIRRLFFAGEAPEGGWSLYVNLRVPHHVLPDMWPTGFWIVELSVGFLLALVLARYARIVRLRFLASLVAGSGLLFGAGLLLWISGATDLLRFYWFRFPDTLIPFFIAMMIALLLSRLFERYPASESRMDSLSVPERSRTLGLKQGAELLLTLLLVTLSLAGIIRDLPSLEREDGWASTPYTPMFDWIAENTPRDAVFLIDPAMQEFYVRAERALFVSFKHSPQSAGDVAEWHRRLVLCNGGTPLQGKGFSAAKRIKANFYRLDSAQIGELARQYGVDYYLGREEQALPFARVHRWEDLTLYKVR